MNLRTQLILLSSFITVAACWAQTQGNPRWTYTLTLPDTTNTWVNWTGLTAETGETLWRIRTKRFDYEAPVDKVDCSLLWLDSEGRPNKETNLVFPVLSWPEEQMTGESGWAEPLWVGPQVAAYIITHYTPIATTYSVIEMSKTTSEVTTRHYFVRASPQRPQGQNATPLGFFTAEFDSPVRHFTVAHYQWGAQTTPLLSIRRQSSTDLEVSWQSETALRYIVEASQNLNHWTSVSDQILGTGSTITYSEALASPGRFLRVRAEKQP